MNEDHDRIQELLAGYVLLSLSGEDAVEADRLLSEHVPSCPLCRDQVAGFQAVAGDLALAVSPAQPPDLLLPRIRLGVDETPIRGRHRASLVAVAAGVAAIVGLAGLSVQLGGRVSRIPGVVEVEFGDDGPEETEPTASEGRTVTTSGPTPTTAGISVGPWTETVDGLTLRVERVIRRRDGSLEIEATVDNQTGDSLSLPVGAFFVAIDDLGNSFEGDPFGSEWPETFPSGKQTGGTIRLDVPVTQDAATLSIDFTKVFGTFRVESIGIDGISLP